MIDVFLTKHNLSQRALAKKLGVGKSTIQDWVKRSPRYPVLTKLALERLAQKLKGEK